MNRLIRMWNQNRIECIAAIFVIVAIIIAIQVLNSLYERQAQEQMENTQKEVVPINDVSQVQNVQIEKESTEQIMGSGDISSSTATDNEQVMKQFIQYCNAQNAEAAYNLLSAECKQILFPTLEKFTQNYIQSQFQTKKELDYELWKVANGGYTYRITLYNNALATGNLQTDNSYKDYYTVVLQNGTRKLNLSGLIRFIEKNQTVEQQNVVWKVTGKEIYKDYEIYTVQVKNYSGKTILLDPLQTNGTIYGTGDGNVTYSAFSNEIPMASMLLQNYATSTLRVKINKIYNDISIRALTFNQVVYDYDTYIQGVQNFNQVEISVE